MKQPLSARQQRLSIALPIGIVLLACSLSPWSSSPPSQPPPATTRVVGTMTRTPGQIQVTARPAATPSARVEVSASATASIAGPAVGPLKIKDRYLFFPRIIFATSLASSPGKVWIGTGTIQEVNSESGAFGPVTSLIPFAGEAPVAVYPVQKMEFEGKYLWVWADLIEKGRVHPSIFAIDSDNRAIVHQWDLDTVEWSGEEGRFFEPDDFGVSPGRIWIDGHVIDTQTLEVQTGVPMPQMTQFAYNGRGWMWMTGENGGACDDLLLVKTDDPTQAWCPDSWPFITHQPDGTHAVGLGSPMVLAGDRMWAAGGWSGDPPSYVLEAYPADMDLAMQQTKPLASVPLLGSDSVRMLYAGNTLWLIYTDGEKLGWLYQLDPQTGATLDSLDLVGDSGRSVSDVPQDLVAEGENLWVLTTRQLLRIPLP